MPFNTTNSLWPSDDGPFFSTLKMTTQKQSGPHCVATVLGMLSHNSPEHFFPIINTQDPVSWSVGLHPSGMKLAYCPVDIRKLKWYASELIAHNDLFILSYYTSLDSSKICADPDEHGWVTGSHVVILHGSTIHDTSKGKSITAVKHPCMEHHTKRIFRVVPFSHSRGL